MISTIELYNSIRDRLEKTFPNRLVQQKDIKNIIRPSFYIQYVGGNLEKTAVEYYEDKISFNIIYFSEKEELLEILEVEETLKKAFNDPLIIKDDKYYIEVEKNAIQSSLNEEDYYSNITIDFVLSQRMSADETGENIEEIEVEVDKESDSPKKSNWIISKEGEDDNLMSDIEITT